MKQVLFSIFAHPDDESFGPSGTLIQEADGDTDVHMLCVTRGDAGRNTDGHEDLGAVRIKEWQAAAKLIGATSTYHLGYSDGKLCNHLYHQIADKLTSYIADVVDDYEEPTEISMLTFDGTGLSGHLDHIAVTMIASFIYIRLQQEHSDWQFGGLRYFCLPYSKSQAHDIGYVYSPPGRRPDEIHESRDVSDVYQRKLEVMKTHHSQRQDMNWIIDTHGEEGLKTEHFRLLNP